jgi:hypothetical protein
LSRASFVTSARRTSLMADYEWQRWMSLVALVPLILIARLQSGAR